ncbi:MAG: alpha/beta hydrolase [Anaerolineae bacterium]|nr:alpha/beta hydrolase [Anaerolineae bacterium]
MNETRINGLRIAYEHRGEGPPLVLLHGGLIDSRMWRDQIDGLSDEFTVVAWDAPGSGRSEDPPEDILLSGFADYLAAFIQHLGLRRPHVLGLSFGGGLAIEFYHRHPDIPQTLILAGAYAGWGGSLSPEVIKERLENGIKQSEFPPEQVVAAWLPTFFSESTPADTRDTMAEILYGFHPVGMRAQLKAFAQADLRDVLPTIKVPTLLLYGDHDQRSPQYVAEKLYANIPRSKLVYLPGVGHVCNMEAPEAFNTEVRNFIRMNQ